MLLTCDNAVNLISKPNVFSRSKITIVTFVSKVKDED